MRFVRLPKRWSKAGAKLRPERQPIQFSKKFVLLRVPPISASSDSNNIVLPAARTSCSNFGETIVPSKRVCLATRSFRIFTSILEAPKLVTMTCFSLDNCARLNNSRKAQFIKVQSRNARDLSPAPTARDGVGLELPSVHPSARLPHS